MDTPVVNTTLRTPVSNVEGVLVPFGYGPWTRRVHTHPTGTPMTQSLEFCPVELGTGLVIRLTGGVSVDGALCKKKKKVFPRKKNHQPKKIRTNSFFFNPVSNKVLVTVRGLTTSERPSMTGSGHWSQKNKTKHKHKHKKISVPE